MRCDPILSRVARARALDMGTRRYFDHVPPSGDAANRQVERAGYALPRWYPRDRTANNIEVIAAGDDTPDRAWRTWLQSRPHRAQVLWSLSPRCRADRLRRGLCPGAREPLPSLLGAHYRPSLTRPASRGDATRSSRARRRSPPFVARIPSRLRRLPQAEARSVMGLQQRYARGVGIGLIGSAVMFLAAEPRVASQEPPRVIVRTLSTHADRVSGGDVSDRDRAACRRTTGRPPTVTLDGRDGRPLRSHGGARCASGTRHRTPGGQKHPQGSGAPWGVARRIARADQLSEHRSDRVGSAAAPFVCQTDTFKLPDGSVIGQSQHADCSFPTRVTMSICRPAAQSSSR